MAILTIPGRAAMPLISKFGENKIVKSSALLAPGQNILENIKGKVTDEKGDALPGVNILVKGTQQGTTTSTDGTFVIDVPASNAVLVFSFVGYQVQEVKVGNNSTLDVKLLTDTKSLNEVVVTALGIKKEAKSLGYSVTKISGESFTKTRETNIGNSLAGKVAGVNVAAAATGPAGPPRALSSHRSIQTHRLATGLHPSDKPTASRRFVAQIVG